MDLEKEKVDLAYGRHLTLGQLTHVLRLKRPLLRQLREGLDNGAWFVDQFPEVLAAVLKVRNPGVHSERIDRDTATQLRNRLMGVGAIGEFAQLARVRPKR